MSLPDRLLEKAEQDLRQVEREMEREMKRQMRQLDLHLQQLHKELPVPPSHSPALHPRCLCQPEPSPGERRALTARLYVEPERSR